VSAAAEVWRRRGGWLAGAGLFLLANGAFLFWYRGTGRIRQDALEARRVALSTQVGAAEREAERLQVQSQRLSKVSGAIEEFYGKRIGTERATLASVVDEIHATLKRVGIAPSQISYSTKPLAKVGLSEMDAGFSFAADYKKLKRLIDAFEIGPRWIVVKEIALARDDSAPGSVQVRMTVATYFSDEHPEDGGRLAAAGGTPIPAPKRRS